MCAKLRFVNVPSDVTFADTQRGLQLLDMATQDAKVIAINVKIWPTVVIGLGSSFCFAVAGCKSKLRQPSKWLSSTCWFCWAKPESP
jgi:hypothetical protein